MPDVGCEYLVNGVVVMKLLHIGKTEVLERYTPVTPFAKSVEMVTLPLGRSVADYLAIGADADVIVADAIAAVPADLIEAMPRLRLIHSEGVAYNGIDVDAAAKHGVCVCNSAGMNSEAVAEQAVLLMLGVLRDVCGNDLAVRSGRQFEVKNSYMADGSLRSLSECSVGLVGLGGIGRATARLLKAFGTRTCYWQRHRASEDVELECDTVWAGSLEALLRDSDIVSLHVPVTPETTGICDERFFSLMRSGSYLINTSRGELVDNDALAAALKNGRLAMAGLDTLDHEPVAADHPLLSKHTDIANKLLLSPHIGGITGSSFRKSYQIIWDNIERLSRGERPKNIVNAVGNAAGGGDSASAEVA